MMSRGITINLNNFQNERIEISFPLHLLPHDIADADEAFRYVSTWVEEKLTLMIKNIVSREARLGNHIVAPMVGPPQSGTMHATAPLPAGPPTAQPPSPPQGQPVVFPGGCP